jgi:BirA family transcriptional regulator, biotin operon repressor / biotin---[acetyl-CoA-carboxylase] ligase
LYKIPANTLFIGKQLVFVPECHSTNTLALQISQSKAANEGTVVITNNQTAGRGQRGNTWESAAGMNLTFSVIFTPGFLEPKEQFQLTVVTSLAICDFLETKCKVPVSIKWPNDILIEGKKIAGILIENQVQGSRITYAIVGIGLNINQTGFQYGSATSLKAVTDSGHQLEAILHEVLQLLEVRYLQLKQQKKTMLGNAYLSKLYLKDHPHVFTSNNKRVEGIIRGVDNTGRLCLESEGVLQYFGNKEIAF